MTELVLIRGLPGSGKSTLARKLVGYDHHEADQYFERFGKYEFNPAKLPEAHAQCLRRARYSMSRGRPVVVSNTFTRKWEMDPYIKAAAEYGYPVRVVVATGSWQNVHDVPDKAIAAMKTRWEQ